MCSSDLDAGSTGQRRLNAMNDSAALQIGRDIERERLRVLLQTRLEMLEHADPAKSGTRRDEIRKILGMLS